MLEGLPVAIDRTLCPTNYLLSLVSQPPWARTETLSTGQRQSGSWLWPRAVSNYPLFRAACCAQCSAPVDMSSLQVSDFVI